MTLKSLVCTAVCWHRPSHRAEASHVACHRSPAPPGAPIATIEPAAVQLQDNGVLARTIKVEPRGSDAQAAPVDRQGVGLPSEGCADLRKGRHGLLAGVPRASRRRW